LPLIASVGKGPPAGEGNRLGKDAGPVITSKSDAVTFGRAIAKAPELAAASPSASFA